MPANDPIVNSPAVAIEPGHPLPDYAEIAHARRRFSTLLEGLTPPLSDAGHRVLDRISTANWSMEWCLPVWLARDLRLGTAERRSLVLSSALGLAHVRLMDDLVDGDVEPGTEGVEAMLAGLLYHHAIMCYVELVGDDARFWGPFGRFVAQWRASTMKRDGPKADLRRLGDGGLFALSERGAPLKIGCVAACLLAKREEAMPNLLSALDHWLVAAVLLDHTQDWAGDLEAGRFNALVAHVVQQSRSAAGMTPFSVAQAILLGDAMGICRDVIRQHLEIAVQMAGTAGCPALGRQMKALGNQALARSKSLEKQSKARLRAATQQLFGASHMYVQQSVGREEGEPDES